MMCTSRKVNTLWYATNVILKIVVFGIMCIMILFRQTGAVESSHSMSIEPQEKWQTVFGGGEYIYHFQINSVENIDGLAGWSLAYAGRTIARGECSFESGPDKGGVLEIPIKVPSVNEGIMLPIQFTITLYGKEKNELLISWEETLRIFSKDPFVFKKEWLKGLKIGLFDPEKKTSGVFQELGIPHSVLNNVDVLQEYAGDLLIVGNGIDFSNHRGLWNALLQVCVKNIPVLVITPGGGTVAIPGVEGFMLPEPVDMRFLHNSIIRELDKNLDAEAWPPDGKVVISNIIIKPERQGIVGEFVSEDKGWPWFEMNFTGKGKLVVCGFGIIDKIDAGPTPRILLARLLEYLIGTNETKKERGKE